MVHPKFNITKKFFLCLVPLSLTFTGCFGYRDVVDPYYPKRYNVDARNSVRTALAPQVSNGNVLDQTVWDFHFESGKPELNAMGKDHLKRLARRRPAPQEVIFLQVAQNPDERLAHLKTAKLYTDDLEKLTNEEQNAVDELKKIKKIIEQREFKEKNKNEIQEERNKLINKLSNEERNDFEIIKKLNALKEIKKLNEIKKLKEMNEMNRLTELKNLNEKLTNEELNKLKELVEKNKTRELNKIKELKELNMARSESIKAYMTQISEDKVHPEFQVVLHDPAEVSGSGIESTRVIIGKILNASGTFIPGQSGSSSGGGNSGQSGGIGNTQVNITSGY
ncbi:MAG: hypothetical protein RL553_66 [Planctomycetota bacterium]|jgi:hypothetical protein